MSGDSNSERARRPGSCLLTGCLVTFLGAGIVAFLAVIATVVFAMIAPAASLRGQFGTERRFRFREVTLSGQPRRPKVVRVPVEGFISSSASFGQSVDPVSLFKAQLDRAAEDNDVAAVLLTVNSPGGGVTASDMMHERLRRFTQRERVPVVALLEDVAASGGYYVASAADRIVAQPTTLTGSIGVMMPMYDATELLKYVGVEDKSVTSGAFKDMGSPFARKSEEQRKKERAVFKQVIDHMHRRFVAVVATGRDLEPAEFEDVADGRVLTSEEALEEKLVDKIGYYEDALELAEEMAGIEAPHVVQYKRVVSLSEALSLWAKGPQVRFEVGGRLPASLRSRPMYLWTPPADEE